MTDDLHLKNLQAEKELWRREVSITHKAMNDLRTKMQTKGATRKDMDKMRRLARHKHRADVKQTITLDKIKRYKKGKAAWQQPSSR